MIKKILVPVDGSESSKKALELACELGENQGSALHVLHIAQPPAGKRVLVLGAAAVTVEANPEELKETGNQVVSSAEEIARNHGIDKVSVSVVGGDPAARIIDYAKSKKIDMIVMGTRGLSDLSGLLMGSVSHKVSHLAPCTCVTVR
jgi:nucleotide-binding universal stress UspA family protein